jgi:N-acetylglutamate synthase-like GNAT family acetyltransferase
MVDPSRTPPTKIRVTGLQEAQLPALCRIELACAAMHYEVGLDETAVRPRTEAEIAGLHRTHDVWVAEADHEVAGYLAWRDEQPKIGCVAILNVHPELQRFGIGTRLLRQLADSCADSDIAHVVARYWSQASWAAGFLDALQFHALAGELPAPVAAWRDRLELAGELALPGQLVRWRSAEGLGVKLIPGIPPPT